MQAQVLPPNRPTSNFTFGQAGPCGLGFGLTQVAILSMPLSTEKLGAHCLKTQCIELNVFSMDSGSSSSRSNGLLLCWHRLGFNGPFINGALNSDISPSY
eukprot:TRINITY_DN16119_c2_g1_i1.p1 TRINITY_DN16119_c2_g1~~TRINITY_DN16119_c2_g1_i1.p1  ORF type:complete len:100 (+),score=13.13 TRINITY_DN16119_c2_g1_i1:498-797(+)